MSTSRRRVRASFYRDDHLFHAHATSHDQPPVPSTDTAKRIIVLSLRARGDC